MTIQTRNPSSSEGGAEGLHSEALSQEKESKIQPGGTCLYSSVECASFSGVLGVLGLEKDAGTANHSSSSVLVTGSPYVFRAGPELVSLLGQHP